MQSKKRISNHQGKPRKGLKWCFRKIKRGWNTKRIPKF